MAVPMTRDQPVFRRGDRVVLTAMPDDYPEQFQTEAGMSGLVEFVDSLGTTHVAWDNNKRFGIIASAAGLLQRAEPPEMSHPVIPLNQARIAAARHLVATFNSHPRSAASTLLRQLQQSREVICDLLASSETPSDDPVIPMLLLRRSGWWNIRPEAGAWVGESRYSTTVTALWGHDPAELAGKLKAAEEIQRSGHATPA
jgi:hypothetical protein